MVDLNGEHWHSVGRERKQKLMKTLIYVCWLVLVAIAEVLCVSFKFNLRPFLEPSDTTNTFQFPRKGFV